MKLGTEVLEQIKGVVDLFIIEKHFTKQLLFILSIYLIPTKSSLKDVIENINLRRQKLEGILNISILHLRRQRSKSMK